MRLSVPVKRAASGKQSAGLLLYRLTSGDPEVLLGHPGGPFCRKKDLASWSIPKGLIAEGEPPLVAAKREFNEETGYSPRGETLPLGEARQPGGKTVHVWAVERLGSGRPPEQYVRDGVAAKIRTAVIVSRARRAAWFDLAEVRAKILKGQGVFLDRLLEALAVR